MSRPLLRLSFFQQDVQRVAQEILGQILVFRPKPSEEFRVRITETEAYLGPHDLAAHSRFGVTARNQVMFEGGGRAYIYFIYGVYEMLNVVTGLKGQGQAVLIRAGECLSHPHLDLSGPGKLTRAIGINRKWNGKRLDSKELYFLKGPAPEKILKTPRIGVDYAGAWAKRKLRFLDADSSAVSLQRKKSFRVAG